MPRQNSELSIRHAKWRMRSSPVVVESQTAAISPDEIQVCIAMRNNKNCMNGKYCRRTLYLLGTMEKKQ